MNNDAMPTAAPQPTPQPTPPTPPAAPQPIPGPAAAPAPISDPAMSAAAPNPAPAAPIAPVSPAATPQPNPAPTPAAAPTSQPNPAFIPNPAAPAQAAPTKSGKSKTPIILAAIGAAAIVVVVGLVLLLVNLFGNMNLTMYELHVYDDNGEGVDTILGFNEDGELKKFILTRAEDRSSSFDCSIAKEDVEEIDAKFTCKESGDFIIATVEFNNIDKAKEYITDSDFLTEKSAKETIESMAKMYRTLDKCDDKTYFVSAGKRLDC